MASHPLSESVVTDSVVSFLAKIPPFQFLSHAELSKLTARMTIEFFPKDTVILHAGHPASESLYVVHKGAVKLALRSHVGKQLTLDMRSEGEIFGLLSILGKDLARLDVTAVEDTLCYRIPADEMQWLMSSNLEIANYLLRTSLTRYMDRSLQEPRTQTGLMGDTERLLYSLSVSDVPGSSALLCQKSTTVHEAAQMLVRAKSTCIFVVNESSEAIGIVTDRDFAEKVAAQSMSLDLPVTEIMSKPVVAVDASDRIFHALLAMVSRNIHHILVTRQGRPAGVLTAHDLMMLQGKSPLNVVRFIEAQTTIPDLAAAQTRISGLIPLLLREGAKASHVTRVIAEVNDRLIAKILQLAETRIGTAPVPYCWIVLGSEGRREQTFKTDQDNALILGDSVDEPGRQYFSQLSSFVQEALSTCGYPLCPGNYMASNPRWRQTSATWISYFQSWISGAELHGTEDALIFFDMRPVAGDFSLFQTLKRATYQHLKDASLFKSILALVATTHKPPIGFFRSLVLERSGEHKNQLDMKTHGTGPIVNAARVFALDAGIEHTNTADRLEALTSVAADDSDLFRDLQEAFEFLTLLRLECQLRQLREGQALNNFIAPETLTHLQRSLLKETFRTVARAQHALEDKFRTAIWSTLGR